MSKYTTSHIDKGLRPFEVLQVDTDKVAVHIGVILDSGTYKEYKADDFVTSAKPQDITDELLTERFVFVEEGHIVYIRIPIPEPNAKIELLRDKIDVINEIKRSDYRVIQLAKIVKIEDDVMDIEYRYKSDLQYQSAFFPPFTPIMWTPESEEGDASGDQSGEASEEAEQDEGTCKCIFTPGACHLSHKEMSPDNPRIFKINGQSMLDFPIVDVSVGESWYINMPIDKTWEWSGEAVFGNTEPEPVVGPDGKVYLYVIGEDPCGGDLTGRQGECSPQDANYMLKVLEFVKTSKVGDGITPKIYWRSDYIIHKNPRCHCCECTEDSSSGSGSDSDPGGEPGSSKTAIIRSPHSSTGYLGFMCVEGAETWFQDVYKVPIDASEQIVALDPAFVDACEPQSLFAEGYTSDKPVSVGIRVVGDYLVIQTGVLKRPENVNVSIYGVRKGHKERLPEFTKGQYETNREFYESAHRE